MGETDISGLGLLEAHLGLDWAAERLGPNFLQYSPSTSIHAHSFSPNAPQHVHRALSHKATYTVSTYILSQPHSLYVDFLAGTPSHTHSFPTNHKHAMLQCSGPQHLSFYYVHILLHSPSQHSVKAYCGEGPGPNFQWLGTKISMT